MGFWTTWAVASIAAGVVIAPSAIAQNLLTLDRENWRDVECTEMGWWGTRGTGHIVKLPKPWVCMKNEGTPKIKSPPETGGVTEICLVSNEASFSINLALNDSVDLERTPILEWEWETVDAPDVGDFKNSSEDNQAASLFITIDPLPTSLAGVPFFRAVNYIWDNTQITGVTESPRIPRLRIEVVDSGTSGLPRCVVHRRNVAENLTKRFDLDALPNPSAIRFQINSQYSGGGRAESCLRRVKFLEQMPKSEEADSRCN